MFHQGIVAGQLDLLIAEIDAISDEEISWDLRKLGISRSAFKKVNESGGRPHQVFAHPSIIGLRPYLIGYYRNIATISKKGISQILFPTDKYESRRAARMGAREAKRLCRTLNQIISGVIDALTDYEVSVSRQAILAEIGAQLQGTWANIVGQGATKAVEGIIGEHVKAKRLGEKTGPGTFLLKNGWGIVFASEPDVAFFDNGSKKQIAIEIKGSLDKAGAQTRYGEAKKSFAKQIRENPRCHTIYLASCFTDAVIQQIETDGQVRDRFNLTSILYDSKERTYFLRRLFHIVNAPTK